MKKFLPFILSAVMVFSLASCGDDTGSSTTTEESSVSSAADESSTEESSTEESSTEESSGNLPPKKNPQKARQPMKLLLTPPQTTPAAQVLKQTVPQKCLNNPAFSLCKNKRQAV